MNVSLSPARMEEPALISSTRTSARVPEEHKVHTDLESFVERDDQRKNAYGYHPHPTFLSPLGVHCEINLDDCTPSSDPLTNEPKCFNNGKCVDRIGGYQCMCPAGYVGERCEGDVNECLSDPCDPRGSYNCIQLTNSYRCECRTGYTGTDVHPAARNKTAFV